MGRSRSRSLSGDWGSAWSDVMLIWDFIGGAKWKVPWVMNNKISKLKALWRNKTKIPHSKQQSMNKCLPSVCLVPFSIFLSAQHGSSSPAQKTQKPLGTGEENILVRLKIRLETAQLPVRNIRFYSPRNISGVTLKNVKILRFLIRNIQKFHTFKWVAFSKPVFLNQALLFIHGNGLPCLCWHVVVFVHTYRSVS